MNRNKLLVSGLLILFCTGAVRLFAAEGDIHSADISLSLQNNQYFLENVRLIGLADKCYSEGQYDDAVQYAQEAIKYAQMSDDYVALHIKIREVNDAIAAARERLDWAEKTGAPKSYAAIYEQAQDAFENALDARSSEDWDGAGEAAHRVITILADLPDQPMLPAQYLVKTWASVRDCLWNIAGKKEIYGDPFQWRVIYNANKNKLPRPNDPDLIEPGMILDIPSVKGESRSGRME